MARGCVKSTNPANKDTPAIPPGHYIPWELYKVTSLFGKVSYVFETPGMKTVEVEPNRGHSQADL